MSDKVVIFRDNTGDWRWRYVAANGHIMADSGEGYRRKKDCKNGAKRVTGVIDRELKWEQSHTSMKAESAKSSS